MLCLIGKEFLRRRYFKIVLPPYFMDLPHAVRLQFFCLDIPRCTFLLSPLVNWGHVCHFSVAVPDSRAQWGAGLLHLYFLSDEQTKIVKLLKLLKQTTIFPALEKISLQILFYLFFKDFIYLFLERVEGREKGRETSMCGCLSCGPGLQPRHVPWLGIKLVTLWFADQHWIYWATPDRSYSFKFYKDIWVCYIF